VLAQSRGLLTGEVGRGTFVLARPDRQSRIRIAAQDAASVSDLVVNQPPCVLSDEEVSTSAAKALATGGADLLGRYPPTAGLERHRAALARWVGRIGMPATADQVLITAGVHSAIAATCLASL